MHIGQHRIDHLTPIEEVQIPKMFGYRTDMSVDGEAVMLMLLMDEPLQPGELRTSSLGASRQSIRLVACAGPERDSWELDRSSVDLAVAMAEDGASLRFSGQLDGVGESEVVGVWSLPQ